MKLHFLALLFPVASGCAFVHEGQVPDIVPLARPLFGAIEVNGLEFLDQRVAGSMQSVVQVHGDASSEVRVTGPQGRSTGSVTTGAVLVGSGNTTYYEAYSNEELRGVARRAIEDFRIAAKVVDNAPIRLEGRLESMGSSTGVGRVTWNVLSVGSLLFAYGLPLMGSSRASVELRVFAEDELVGKYEGEGVVSWTASIYRMKEAKKRSQLAAAEHAVLEAVAELSRRPPGLDGFWDTAATRSGP